MPHHHANGARRRAQSGQARLALVFAVAFCGGGYLTASAVGSSLTAGHARIAGLDRSPTTTAHRPVAAGPAAPALNGVTSRPGSRLRASAIPLLHADAVTLPNSTQVSEPSLAVDSKGSFYVTGPTGIGHAPTISASPLWKSSDGGRSFIGPISTGTAGQTLAEVGGGDSDIVVDNGNNLYLASLWLGNSSVSISSDGGNTWIEQPLGHTTPVDDRPWLAYDPLADNLYMAWDGGDGLHVAKATLRAVTSGTAAAPAAALVFTQDTVAVPEVILSGTPAGGAARECVCPPGGLAVDPAGTLYLAYSSQNGVGIASSTDQGLTWTISYVPNTTPTTGGASQLDYIFQPIKTDSAGNAYVVFSTTAVNNSLQVFVSYLQHGTTTWSAPVPVSASQVALMGALAVVAPGVIDVAYYGTNNFSGDPNGASSSTEWNLYLAQVHNLFTTPVTLTADAYPSVHSGVISSGGITGSGDRSLGDFFSIVVDNHGMAGIVTAAGSAAAGTRLVFIHQLPDTLAPTPTTLRIGLPPAQQPPAAIAPAPPPPATPAPQPPASAPGDGGTAAASGGSDAAPAGKPASATPPAIKEPTALARAAQPGGAPPASPLLALAALVAATAAGGLLLHRLNRRG